MIRAKYLSVWKACTLAGLPNLRRRSVNVPHKLNGLKFNFVAFYYKDFFPGTNILDLVGGVTCHKN